MVLLPPSERTMTMRHAHGWSGQTSWWYADDTVDHDARQFVDAVKERMDGNVTPTIASAGKGGPSRKGRAGSAASKAHMRYVAKYEARVHPRHHQLQERFKAFIETKHTEVRFPRCFRDDLRYAPKGQTQVMVEVKPTDPGTIRFAIRTAMGQLFDYRQHQQWKGPQLIVVENAVENAYDLELAFVNGFGLAWPSDDEGQFEIRWPD